MFNVQHKKNIYKKGIGGNERQGVKEKQIMKKTYSGHSDVAVTSLQVTYVKTSLWQKYQSSHIMTKCERNGDIMKTYKTS